MFQRGQAVAGDQCGSGIVKHHLGRAAAILRAVTLGDDAAGITFDEEHGQRAIHHGGHQIGIGLVSGGYYAFGSCQRPSSLRWSGFCFTFVELVTGFTFLVGQHDEGFTTGHLGQPFGLHVGGGITREHTTCNQRMRQRLHHDAAAQLFHGQHAFGRAHAHTAVVFRDVQATQAKFSQFCPRGT